MGTKNAIMLSAGGVIDGTGGPIRRDMILEITGGRIVGIGRAEADAAARNKEHEDFSGYTLLPAFADTHVHLCMSGRTDEMIRRRQLNQTCEEARPTIERHLEEHLSCGVLAVRDGGDYGGYAHCYRREFLDRRVLPMMLQAAGRAWHAPGRYGGLVGCVPPQGHTLARAIRNMRERVDVIKIVNSGLNSLSDFGKETPPQFPPAELREAVKQAEELGLKTMVHANGYQAVKEAVEAGCHSIEHGFFMGPDNLMRLRDRGVTWVPTAVTMAAYARILTRGSREADTARRTLEHQLDQIRLAGELGVTVAVGTDAGSPGVHHGHAVREEMKLLMKAGFSLEKAVQCATLNGAALLGLDKDMGVLRAGMPATFQVFKGDPENFPDTPVSMGSVYIAGKIWEKTLNTASREPLNEQ